MCGVTVVDGTLLESGDGFCLIRKQAYHIYIYICGMWYDRSDEKNMHAAMPGNVAVSEERLSKVFTSTGNMFLHVRGEHDKQRNRMFAGQPAKQGGPSCMMCSSSCLKSSLWLRSSMCPLVALSPLCAKIDGCALI